MNRKHWKFVVVAAALAAGAPALAESKAGKLDKKLVEAAQKLHASNQGEVQAGQLGSQQAQSPEVKAFADRMATDHQQNDQQLTQLTQTMGVALQGDAFTKKQRDAQKELKDVQGKSGADFDKAYMKMMVKEHERDVKEVGDAAKDAKKANQAELASFLDQTHSHLQMHLDEAKRVESSLGKSGGVAGTSGSTGTSGDATSPSSTGTSGAAASDRSSTAGPPSRESRGDTGGSTPTTGNSPGASGSTGTSGEATSPSSTGAGTSGTAYPTDRSSTAAPPSSESRGDTGGSTPTTGKSPGSSGSTGSSDTQSR